MKIKNITKLVTICSLAFFMSLPLYSEIDFSKASFTIVKEYAEKMNSAEAQHAYGLLYYCGCRELEKDYTQALIWFVKAAEQGHAKAQKSAASMYYYGRGTKDNKPDYENAFRWNKKSAEGGNIEALYGLGVMYYRGRGVKQDNIEAYKWFFLSSNNGDKDSKKYILKLESLMLSDQIKKAKDLALKWQKEFEAKQK